VDNQGAFRLIHHPHSHQRTKHINIAYRFIQDRVERGDIICEYVETANMVAYCITKAEPLAKLNDNKTDMGRVFKPDELKTQKTSRSRREVPCVEISCLIWCIKQGDC
jgi:hypothetical protein